MDAHDTAEEIVDFDLFATEFFQKRFYTLLRGVIVERIQNIAVSGRITTEDQAENGHNDAEIGEVKRAPKRVRGFAEIENEQGSAGLQDAEQLGKASLKTSKVAQAVADGDDVKPAGGEWKMESIRLDVRDGLRAGGSDPEHGSAEIATDDLSVLGVKCLGDIACAAADIESANAFPECG